jgi:hypothetical protein
MIWTVTPAEAGVQYFPGSRLSPGRCLDTGLRRYDVGGGFSIQYEFVIIKCALDAVFAGMAAPTSRATKFAAPGKTTDITSS